MIHDTKDLCKDCPMDIKGLCCHESIILEGFNIVLHRRHCKYFDFDTKICNIYEFRKEVNVTCGTIEEAIEEGALPKGCAYLKGKGQLPKAPRVSMGAVIGKLNAESIMRYNVINNRPRELWDECVEVHGEAEVLD